LKIPLIVFIVLLAQSGAPLDKLWKGY